MSDTPSAPRRLLALDTGSPVVSVALAIDGEVRAESSVEQARSSVELLQRIDACLKECGLEPSDLDAVAVLRGPGSFTGLRVGLATVQGLAAALTIRVAVLPSLLVLAAHAAEQLARPDAIFTGVIDALRGEWFAQSFRVERPDGVPESLAEAAIVPVASLMTNPPSTIVGFGVQRLAATRPEQTGAHVLEAAPLAATAARLAPRVPSCWNRSLLTEPLYLREPAVTLPAT